MEKCISAHHGVINKYIGDCVMAIFGAPVDDRRHALNAYLAALDMRKELSSVNHTFEMLGLPQIKNGIGMNTGFVTAGNIGAESRMEYTVIGDAVNVASRIEGLCKEYGQDFLISESTASAVIELINADERGSVSAPEFLCESPIRGKAEKIRIWKGCS